MPKARTQSYALDDLATDPTAGKSLERVGQARKVAPGDSANGDNENGLVAG